MPAQWFSRYIDRSWTGGLLLLVSSCLIYLFYFHHIIFNLNSVMSSLTLDTIKNYYTFAWHIRHDDSALHVAGIQYPYGEHVVYTDAQPLLTFILRWLPFLDPYSVGIMHGLIFLSFVFTPLVVRDVLLELDVEPALAWTGALGLSLLSPQFLKMNAGHFGLCYTVLIPLLMLLTVRHIKSGNRLTLFWLFCFNSALFWLHPYMGFGTSVFSLIAFSLRWLIVAPRKHRWLTEAFFAGLLPILLFQLTMKLTDSHGSRPTEPFGLDVMVENFGSLLTPGFGPFRKILGAMFPEPTSHFEGHSYLGFANILLLIALPFIVLYISRKKPVNTPATLLFVASGVFLPVAFGWHHDLLEYFNYSSPAVNQFRAVSRFAWFVYYGTGIFLLTAVSQLFSTLQKSALPAGVLYLAFCLPEAHALFTLDKSSFWQWRNVFNDRQLTAEEKNVLSHADSANFQAIIPLPVFHGGTEMYDRPGRSNAMLPAFIYSYHAGLPLVSMMASRTSHTETRQMLDLLNSYKTERPVFEHINALPFLVIRTKDECLPDEDRLWGGARQWLFGDSMTFASLNPSYLSKPILGERLVKVSARQTGGDTLKDIAFIPAGNHDIFSWQPHPELQTFHSIGKNTLTPGRYVVSFHYHYKGDTYRALNSTFVFAEDPASGGQWLEYIPLRILSGFYEGFAVFETYVHIEEGKGYDLVMHNSPGHTFKISNILLRRADVSVDAEGGLLNNFPR